MPPRNTSLLPNHQRLVRAVGLNVDGTIPVRNYEELNAVRDWDGFIRRWAAYGTFIPLRAARWSDRERGLMHPADFVTEDTSWTGHHASVRMETIKDNNAILLFFHFEHNFEIAAGSMAISSSQGRRSTRTIGLLLLMPVYINRSKHESGKASVGKYFGGSPMAI